MSSHAKRRAWHYQVEVLYRTYFVPLCKHPTAQLVTSDEEAVTCVRCKKLLGHYDDTQKPSSNALKNSI